MLRAFVLTAMGGLVLCASCTLLGEGALDDKPAEVPAGSGNSGGANDLGQSCVLPEECSTWVCREGRCATCDSDKDCQGTIDRYCDGTRCAAKQPIGESCTQGTGCLSGHCVDERCCDKACEGTCMACREAFSGESDGTCAPVPAGTNPNGSCGDGYCDDSGACCGQSAEPLGRDCPAECNGGCAGGLCVINVDDFGTDGQPLTCPAGFACEINCFGLYSCANAQINCPGEGERCSVQCQCSGNNTHCCAGMRLSCGNGPCLLGCGEETNACANAEIVCGTNQCEATCDGPSTPLVNCNSSCGCTSC